MNPMKPSIRLIGCPTMEIAHLLKSVILIREKHLNICWIVCGEDGLDEIAIHGKTRVIEIKRNDWRPNSIDISKTHQVSNVNDDGVYTCREFILHPHDFGANVFKLKYVSGANNFTNTFMMRTLFTNSLLLKSDVYAEYDEWLSDFESQSDAIGWIDGLSVRAVESFVLINAAAGLFISGKSDSLTDGFEIMEGAIENNDPYEKLEEYVDATNKEVIH